jgi:hypothetical protein
MLMFLAGGRVSFLAALWFKARVFFIPLLLAVGRNTNIELSFM